MGNMLNFLRGVFWPFLFYVVIFARLARHSRLQILHASLVACFSAMLLAYGMVVFITIHDMGYPISRGWNPQVWPNDIRNKFARTLLAIVILTTLCAGASLFV